MALHLAQPPLPLLQVTNQMQGRPYESEIVTTLVAAVRWLWPFAKGAVAGTKKPAAAATAAAADARAKAAAPAATARFKSLALLRTHLNSEVAPYSGPGIDQQTVVLVNLAGHVEELKVRHRGRVLNSMPLYVPPPSPLVRSGSLPVAREGVQARSLLASQRTCPPRPSSLALLRRQTVWQGVRWC